MILSLAHDLHQVEWLQEQLLVLRNSDLNTPLTLRPMLGMAIVATALVMGGTACSTAASFADGGDDAQAYSDSAPGTVDTGGDGSATPLPENVPEFWSLSGALTITEAGVDLESSLLSVEYWTVDAVRTCEEPSSLSLMGATIAEAPFESVGVTTWFDVSLDLTPAVDLTCPGWPAGALGVGLGTYNGSLNPALVARGLSTEGLYGLYVQNPSSDETVYLVGVAGTQAMFDGTEAAPTDAPAPAGTYLLQSLIVLDL